MDNQINVMSEVLQMAHMEIMQKNIVFLFLSHHWLNIGKHYFVQSRHNNPALSSWLQQTKDGLLLLLCGEERQQAFTGLQPFP